MGGWMGGQVDVWTGGWMDGWVDGWVDGRVGGWRDGLMMVDEGEQRWMNKVVA
jgi:hypothetical protein